MNSNRPSILSDQRFVLEALRLLVTMPGYLRPDARGYRQGLIGMTLDEIDLLLNPVYGTPEQAHREVLDALAALKEIEVGV